MAASYQIKPEQDSCGFFYGTLTVGAQQHRVDLLPRTSFAHAWFVSREVRERMDAAHWLVFIDGDQVASTATRELAEVALRDWAELPA
jgi:hypothetical protein